MNNINITKPIKSKKVLKSIKENIENESINKFKNIILEIQPFDICLNSIIDILIELFKIETVDKNQNGFDIKKQLIKMCEDIIEKNNSKKNMFEYLNSLSLIFRKNIKIFFFEIQDTCNKVYICNLTNSYLKEKWGKKTNKYNFIKVNFYNNLFHKANDDD